VNRWRALAITNDGREALLVVDRSIKRVEENVKLQVSLGELVVHPSEIGSVRLQRWNGSENCGKWETVKVIEELT
jgi:hypothetical protein